MECRWLACNSYPNQNLVALVRKSSNFRGKGGFFLCEGNIASPFFTEEKRLFVDAKKM
jgi:hypothetical protein